ncbi:MAG: secretin N-terminal domain-containing protein [Acidobacteriota bacterium]
MSKSRITTGVVGVVLSMLTSVYAQQPQAAQTTPAPQPNVGRAPDYVDFTGFKGKVFDVKHRDPRSLIEAVRPLGSGFKGATIAYSDEFKTLTVRDFPENIAAIEEALKRLDTPQAAQPDIELRLNVLIASNVEGVASQYPNDLGDVVKQMQAMLNYKNYTNLATVVQRVRVGTRNLGINGTAEVPATILGTGEPIPASYDYRAYSMTLGTDSSGGYVVQLSGNQFTFRGNGPKGDGVGQADIRTDLNLRNGEKVVVGTATLGNKGLILVLSARIIK